MTMFKSILTESEMQLLVINCGQPDIFMIPYEDGYRMYNTSLKGTIFDNMFNKVAETLDIDVSKRSYITLQECMRFLEMDLKAVEIYRD